MSDELYDARINISMSWVRNGMMLSLVSVFWRRQIKRPGEWESGKWVKHGRKAWGLTNFHIRRKAKSTFLVAVSVVCRPVPPQNLQPPLVADQLTLFDSQKIYIRPAHALTTPNEPSMHTPGMELVQSREVPTRFNELASPSFTGNSRCWFIC